MRCRYCKAEGHDVQMVTCPDDPALAECPSCEVQYLPPVKPVPTPATP